MLSDRCPDCESQNENTSDVSRRRFLKTAAATAAVATLPRIIIAADEPKPTSENLVKKLYESLTPEQKSEVCFDWDHKDDRGLLRTHVSNNWNITDTAWNVGGKHFTSDQQGIIEALFWGLYNPEWHDRLRKQLQDDAGGYGKAQTIALFGTPGSDKFEFVMTGRHLTIRCDGNTTSNVAFGGPIFYGHAASGFNEPADHAGNVYWHQALKANGLFKMLDGKQRDKALIATAPHESQVGFRGKAEDIPGLPVSELTADQKASAQDILKTLLEPYRSSDQTEARKCLDAKGGLDQCRLAFYKSGDLGNDGVWDNWRLEGPAFVWHYRGTPHVHVWVNVADDSTLPLNAKG
ncbi:MAG: hypothetical protein JWN70_5027 [Planctomycetaceae bacterium]|nr:hypothetical protein [Planctomycetaceae bacterium]